MDFPPSLNTAGLAIQVVCIARVGRVVEASSGRGTVKFFDGGTSDDIDLTMAKAGRGAYVEVFGNLALSVLSTSDAKLRRKEWTAVRKAADTLVGAPRR